MTTRNTEPRHRAQLGAQEPTSRLSHAQVLANAASQVAEAQRHEFDSRVREGLRAENRDRYEDRTKRIKSRAERAGHLDSSWQYTLPKEYQS